MQQGGGRVASFNAALGRDGRWTYEAPAAGFLGGAQTSTLELRGYRVRVDATPAGVPGLFVDSIYGLRYHSPPSMDLVLLPAASFRMQFRTVLTALNFTVQPDGSVTVPAGQAAYLTTARTAGTSVVTVRREP